MAIHRHKHKKREVLFKDGREWTLHPTKGWRSRVIRQEKPDDVTAPLLLRWIRNLCRLRGFA